MACLWLVWSLLHSKSHRCILLLSVTQNPPLHSWLPLPTSLALVYHSSLLAIAWINKSPLAERWHMFLGVNSGIRGLCTTPRKSEAPHKYLSKCLQICQWVCLGIRNDLFYPVWYVRCPELAVTQHPSELMETTSTPSANGRICFNFGSWEVSDSVSKSVYVRGT